MSKLKKSKKIKVKSLTSQDTAKWAGRLAKRVEAGDVIALDGNLGAGKTTFVQGFCRALGVADVVQSPTFVLAQSVQGKRRGKSIPIHHLDFYRMTSRKFFSMGIQEYFSDSAEIPQGVVLVEWASKFPKVIPADAIYIQLSINKDQSRMLVFSAHTAQAAKRLVGLRPKK